MEIDVSKEGVIAYGYVDEQCGLSFQVFSVASVEDGLELIRGNRDEQVMLLLRIVVLLIWKKLVYYIQNMIFG